MNKTIIETSGLTKCYGTFVALDHVCLQLYENEIYGLIGRNGAGKTTLMRSLSGLSIPTSGRILLFGKEQAKLLPAERRNIGCMIEHPGIIPYLTAKENLQLHQILRGLKKTNCKTELELVGLSADAKKKAKKLFFGDEAKAGNCHRFIGKSPCSHFR